MATSTVTAAAVCTTKRKRGQVSYLDEDDELDALLGINHAGEVVDNVAVPIDYDDDDTTTYGSKKVILASFHPHFSCLTLVPDAAEAQARQES